MTGMVTATVAERVGGLDWQRIGADLDGYGAAVVPVLTPDECREVAAWYRAETPFRSRVVMARHGFGGASTSTSPTRSPN